MILLLPCLVILIDWCDSNAFKSFLCWMKLKNEVTCCYANIFLCLLRAITDLSWSYDTNFKKTVML